MMSQIDEMKKKIRSEALAARDAIPARERLAKSVAIIDRLLSTSVYDDSDTILLYAPIGSEVDTTAMVLKSLPTKRVALPRINVANKMLVLFEIRSLDELKKGAYSIPEPPAVESRKVDLAEINLLVIPGVAFDWNGYRLGYGGGYFDKLLLKRDHEKGFAVALAFESQILDSLPHDNNDQRVDLIITEKQTINCRP